MSFLSSLFDKLTGRKRKEPFASEDEDPVLVTPLKRRKMNESTLHSSEDLSQQDNIIFDGFSSSTAGHTGSSYLSEQEDSGLHTDVERAKSNLAPVRSLPRPGFSPRERSGSSADFVPSAAAASSNLESSRAPGWTSFVSPIRHLLPQARQSDSAGVSSPTSSQLYTKEQADSFSESPQQRIARSPLFANKIKPPSIIETIDSVDQSIAYQELLDAVAPVAPQARWAHQLQRYNDSSLSEDEVVIVKTTPRNNKQEVTVDTDDYEDQQEWRRMQDENAQKFHELSLKYGDLVPEEYGQYGIEYKSPNRDHVTPQPVYVSVQQSATEAIVDKVSSIDRLRLHGREISRLVREEDRHRAEEVKAKLAAERQAALSKKRRPELITEAEREQMAKSIVGPDPKTVLTNYDIDMKVEDFKRLRPGQWLNDEVINYYMEMLNERAKKNGVKLHCFSSMFYALLSEKGYSYHRVQRWTRRIDIFSMDRIIAPIHLGNHWCLAVVNFKGKCFEYYDSLGGKNEKVLNVLRRWVQDDSRDKKKVEFDLSNFTDKMPGSSCPQQLNGFDCGVFACRFAECRARDEPFDFSQKDMPYFRLRMWLEILNKQLHSDYD